MPLSDAWAESSSDEEDQVLDDGLGANGDGHGPMLGY